MDFLGHILSREGLRPDFKKLKPIKIGKIGHGQGNSTLLRFGKLLLKVYQKAFANGKTTFEYL